MATKIWVGTDSGNEGDWSVAANWSPSGVPVSTDDVYLEDSSQSVTAGFAQGAVALNSLNIAGSYTGSVGDADDYLVIEATTVNIGYNYGIGTASQSGRIKLDLDSGTASTVNVFNTKTTGTDTNLPPVRLKITNASAVINLMKGKIGIAMETGETSTIGTINVLYTSNVKGDVDCFIGDGVTLTTLNIDGGETSLRSAVTTINAAAGELTTYGSGAITTLNISGTDVVSNSSGTITTANITGGLLDLTKNPTARTITTLKLDAPGVVHYDPTTITLTNDIAPYTTTKIIRYTAS